MSRDAWAVAFAERARAHWTEERTAALTGGKRLAVLPAEAPTLLRALGLLDGDATMPPARVRKFLQINHLVRLIEPSLATLPNNARILDAGCGRSYLTLLLAHCARLRGDRLEVLGIDQNPELIAECRRRTELAELADDVRFEVADLSTFAASGWHAVVALHACDTATCDAIVLGVTGGAQLIAVAPCCQAELAAAWSGLEGTPGAFAPIWNAPHLRREIAADVTDAMRAVLLRAAGYDVTAAELVGHEHTKKNTLLRATRTVDPLAAAASSAPLAAAASSAPLAAAASSDPLAAAASSDPLAAAASSASLAAAASARAEYDALVAATGGCGLALGGRI